ncbi:MAG TPA: DNA-binding transcriptional regulator, partial [Ideonella sp.]|nr:DNA-binding transcriptional regulator [Ideonella sp.]
DRCVLQCGAHTLDLLVYWLLALDVDFEVLAPSALKDRLRLAGERVARCLGTPPA